MRDSRKWVNKTLRTCRQKKYHISDIWSIDLWAKWPTITIAKHKALKHAITWEQFGGCGFSLHRFNWSAVLKVFESVWVVQAMVRRHCIQYELNGEHLLVVTMFSYFFALRTEPISKALHKILLITKIRYMVAEVHWHYKTSAKIDINMKH